MDSLKRGREGEKPADIIPPPSRTSAKRRFDSRASAKRPQNRGNDVVPRQIRRPKRTLDTTGKRGRRPPRRRMATLGRGATNGAASGPENGATSATGTKTQKQGKRRAQGKTTGDHPRVEAPRFPRPPGRPVGGGPPGRPFMDGEDGRGKPTGTSMPPNHGPHQ